jgi:hypothetical protein
MRTIVATCPARESWLTHATARSGAAIAASGGHAPCIAHPSARAPPIGTRISAIHVSTSAVNGTTAMAPTTSAIDSGATSAHARPRKRSAQAGTPAAGSATHADCAATRTRLSAENHMPA